MASTPKDITDGIRDLVVVFRGYLGHAIVGVSRRKPPAHLLNQTVAFAHEPRCR
ncbi:hypothetical protein EXIGLDRAFT_729410 [Exidia glandulosa HHB12029]|uniref:Uncharacterized protein n=1 Tax=Exidia glandulosa HHB12029 TaxID=1314781 RepID=A0A165LIL6_EXIGL|nr:hypothetical protein EXIGLDRAFT_729410 [Exidia glandulosa HHB12029]